jgi:DNA-binding MarR family transcriptional regulator
MQMADRPHGRTGVSGVPQQKADGAASADPDPTSQLAEGVERLMHLFLRTRQQMLDRARNDVDWSAQLLINSVVAHGPMRIKELAEQAQSDPSTVSRHVTQLVRDGFLERHADADDGRATVLTATDKARRSVADRKKLRNDHYEQMLRDWQESDRTQLAVLLGRFIDDFHTYKASRADSDWTKVRTGGREETTS